jgi:hypothetical protein
MEERTHATLAKVSALLERYPEPMVIKKDKLEPRSENSQPPFFQTLAGGAVRDASTGERLLTHEYSHNSMHNTIFAVFERQFGCHTRMNDDDLERFRTMTHAWMDYFVPKFKEVWKPNCCFEYVEKQDSFSRDKKLKYIQGLTRMLSNPKYTNFVGHFSPIVKSGEVYSNTEEESKSDGGFNNATKDRPRCICPPTVSGIGPM